MLGAGSMICGPCKKAGQFNQAANRADALDPEAIRERAREWHKACENSKCTCQHVVGDVLDRTKIKEGLT